MDVSGRKYDLMVAVKDELNPMPSEVRPAAEGDAAAIRRVHESAFPTGAESRLVEALSAADRLLVSLVAQVGERVVGHIAFSPVTVIGGDVPGGVGLAPVAVLPEHQGAGIGSGLIRAGLDRSKADGHTFAVVLGEPGYYARFGFVPATRFGLGNEYGAAEAFMACELRSGSLAAVEGQIARYAPEFAALEG